MNWKERIVMCSTWLKARNESCSEMWRNYHRIGCKDGFVMWNQMLKQIVIIRVKGE